MGSYFLIRDEFMQKKKKNLMRAAAAVMTAGLALGLSACGSGSGQSVADACKIVETEMEAVTAEVNTALSGALGGGDADPAAAFDPLVAGLEKASSQVTNTEVKAVTDDMTKIIKDLAASMADLDLSNLDATDTAAMEKLEAFTATMEEQGDAMQTAGEAIDKLCGAK